MRDADDEAAEPLVGGGDVNGQARDRLRHAPGRHVPSVDFLTKAVQFVNVGLESRQETAPPSPPPHVVKCALLPHEF